MAASNHKRDPSTAEVLDLSSEDSEASRRGLTPPACECVPKIWNLVTEIACATPCAAKLERGHG